MAHDDPPYLEGNQWPHEPFGPLAVCDPHPTNPFTKSLVKGYPLKRLPQTPSGGDKWCGTCAPLMDIREFGRFSHPRVRDERQIVCAFYSLDSSKLQIAFTVAFLASRSSKLYPILIGFDEPFLGQKLCSQSELFFVGKRNSLLNHGDYNRSDTAIEFLEEQTSVKRQYECCYYPTEQDYEQPNYGPMDKRYSMLPVKTKETFDFLKRWLPPANGPAPAALSYWPPPYNPFQG